jgi:putative ABC transport system substrate-binding protein
VSDLSPAWTPDYECVPALIAELIRLDVRIIVADGTPPSLAAKTATDSIPIVTFEISDPIGTGLVPSLVKPGGNLTGVAQLVATDERRLLWGFPV